MDAAKIGFDDNYIYNELSKQLSQRKIPMQQLNQEDAIKVFKEWELKPDKTKY